MIHFTGELAISGNMSERDQKIEFYYYNKIQKSLMKILFNTILTECFTIQYVPLIDSSTLHELHKFVQNWMIHDISKI